MKESRHAVEVAERFADGGATEEELGAAEYWAEADCLPDLPDRDAFEAAWLAHRATICVPLRVDPESGMPFGFTRWFCCQLAWMRSLDWPTARLFHDIFGNPFRPVSFSPFWRTDTSVALAAQMYESRDFSVMPILADALQDAGCDHDDILNHCRQPGEHVRGCWVVDLLLGKS